MTMTSLCSLMIASANRQGRKISLISTIYRFKLPRWIHSNGISEVLAPTSTGSSGSGTVGASHVLLPRTTNSTTTAIGATIASSKYWTTSTNKAENDEPTSTNKSSGRPDSQYHNKMISFAESILTSTALSSSPLESSSTSYPRLPATNAKNLIPYFSSLNYHGMTHLPQLLEQQKLTLSGHRDLDSTGPMLAKAILTKILQLDQQITNNSIPGRTNYRHHVSQVMFQPIIYGFSILPYHLGGHSMECFEQAREVLSMFQQWALVTLNDHHQQQQQQQQQPRSERFFISGRDRDAKRQLQKLHTTSFNMLLKILVKIGTIEAAECAQKMLLEVSELYDTDTTGTFLPPSIESFNAVLRAWSHAAVHSRHKMQQSKDESTTSSRITYCAERAEELLRFLQTLHPTSVTTSRHTPLLQPNETSYNTVMECWASAGNVERVESLFQEMETAAAETEHSTSYSAATSFLYPNRRSFKAVIDAYKNSEGDKYKKKAYIVAMNMLRCLEDLHEKFYPEVRPNTSILNDVIDCWLLADVDDVPIQIDALIARMEQVVLPVSGSQHIKPNAHTYAMALAAWNEYSRRGALRNNPQSGILHPADAARRAEHHLRQLVQLILQDPTKSMKMRNYTSTTDQSKKSTHSLSTDHFHTVLSLYSQCNDPDAGFPQKADEILALMQQCSSSGMPMIQPTFQTYRYIFDIWSESQHPDRGRRCEKLLLLLEDIKKKVKSSSEFIPPAYYKKTIEALLSRSTAIDNNNNNNSNKNYNHAAWRAEAILQRLVKQTRSENVQKVRLQSTHISLARELLKLKSREANEKAKELLRASVNVEYVASEILPHLKSVQDQGLPITKEFIMQSSKLMSTLWRAQSHDATETAKHILFKVEEVSRFHPLSERPDNIMINTVLGICSKCDMDGAQKAQALLDELEGREDNDSDVSHLDNFSYITVIDAWGRSKDKDAPSRVLQLIDKVERRWHQGTHPSLKPHYAVYKAAVRSILYPPSRNSPEKAQIVFDKMVKAGYIPSPSLAREMIKAWCRSGESDRAETVIEATESMLVKIPSEKYKSRYSGFRTRSLECMLKCYLEKSNSSISATNRAEKILHRIISHCDARDPSTTPKTAYIVDVLNALLVDKVDNGAQRSYEILRHVMEVQKREGVMFSPSKSMYEKVLDSLLNSKANKAGKLSEIGEMAEWVLENIEDPDQHSYSLGILAWSCSRNPDKGECAQRVFDRMRQSCTFIPEPHVYQNLVNAWANGSSKQKAEMANLVLSDLIEQCNGIDCTFNPTVSHFNAVLQACIRTPSTGNSHSALRVAMAVFRQLYGMPSVEPNEQTFQMMFEVCNSFVEDQEKRDKLSEKLFRVACQGGFLTQGLLESFWDVSSHGLRKKCLGLFQTDPSSELSVSNFPDEWQYKVNQRSHAV